MKVLTGSKFPVKMWTDGVPVEPEAEKQALLVASLPFVFKHIAVMPDVHVGAGSTVGCVIPTQGAVVPAAVGVDIGCGMCAARSTAQIEEIEGRWPEIRAAIERAVPMGRNDDGGQNDRGAWRDIPNHVNDVWNQDLETGYQTICKKDPSARSRNTVRHLGTLGTGNHFIEVSHDEANTLWVVLHSGSRGPGNRIGSYFTEVAKRFCKDSFIELPQRDLAYLPEASNEFQRYKFAVEWAQKFAYLNRQLMLSAVKNVIQSFLPNVEFYKEINCHHNYIAWENHFGKNVMVTRKGAVRARVGDLGFIPGSMGARSYVVEGLGNPESFHSCSHGAGRVMSRTAAKHAFTVEDHIAATQGVECRKDADVIDETPMAYKNIDLVMAAQSDLVKPLFVLKQVISCKG